MTSGVFGPMLRTAAARAAAVCLLVLIALPFTAPFSTFDLSRHVVHGGVLSADDSLSDKALEDASVADPVMPMLHLPDPPVAIARPLYRERTGGLDQATTLLQLRL